MTVVADTPVILNLCRVQQEHLLQRLFTPVLIDESLGRAVATRLGLRTIGILGVLIEARRRQFIPSVVAVLDHLEKKAGFWIALGLRARVLQQVNEQS